MPQHIEAGKHVVFVGGGLGVAPVYPQLRAFKEAGCRTTSIIGFRNKDLVFWEDKFKKYSDDLIVCTDDGSYGKPGFVTVALKEILEKEKPDMVVAIGPLPMMYGCVETSRPFGVKTMVSLNAIMVDGTGMCGSCRVTVDGQVKFACVEGPDFDGHKVDFKELLSRQKRFKGQEEQANVDYAHVCNLEKQLFDEQKRNYKKIKELEPHQVHMPERDAQERARNFKEVNLGFSLQDALREAERCIQCAKPTCIAGCPVQIDIPRFIRHLIVRDLDGALEAIYEANMFPSICGRVCPQETQCEALCIINKKVESVAIGRLERFVGDNAKAAPGRAAGLREEARQGGRGGLRPGRPGRRRRPGPLRRRRDDLRGPPRGGRRAPLRHPLLPPAPRHHRARGEPPEGHGREDRDQQGRRQDLHRRPAHAGEGLRLGVPRRRRRARPPSWASRASSPARSTRPTSSSPA